MKPKPIMALTYQPFENVPEINALGKKLHKNVSDPERLISACAGAFMMLTGLGRGKIAKWVLVAGGTALLRRAWTGHCPVYEDIEVNRRQKEQSPHKLPMGPQVPADD